jgi:hypothetical protein
MNAIKEAAKLLDGIAAITADTLDDVELSINVKNGKTHVSLHINGGLDVESTVTVSTDTAASTTGSTVDPSLGTTGLGEIVSGLDSQDESLTTVKDDTATSAPVDLSAALPVSMSSVQSQQ